MRDSIPIQCAFVGTRMEQMNVCGGMWSHCMNTVLEVSNTFGSFTLKHKDVSVSESLTQSLVVRLWFIWWNELDHRRLLLQIFCCCCCKDDLQFSFFIKIFIRNKNFSNVNSVFHFFTKHDKHRESQWLFTVIHQHYWQNSNFIIADLICSALLTIWKELSNGEEGRAEGMIFCSALWYCCLFAKR